MAKKSKRSSSSSFPSQLLGLPEELVVEVLLKLPVESLVVLRGVCKLFDTYISSKFFRRSHLQLRANRETKMKHVFPRQDFAPDDDHDLVSRGKKLCSEFAKSALKFRRPRNYRFIFQEDKFKLQFGGCFDGILCFYESSYDVISIYICNPALNECRIVSRPHNVPYSGHESLTRVCFVPDPASDDYKVVLVSGPDVHVFSLNDCCWRDIKTNSQKLCNDMKGFSRVSDLVVHNESVYWMIMYETLEEQYNFLYVLDLHIFALFHNPDFLMSELNVITPTVSEFPINITWYDHTDL